MPDEIIPPGADVLDQSEIDQLVVQTNGASASKTGGLLGGSVNVSSPKITTYDFRSPASLSEPELRRLRLLQEDFVRYLSARLSLYLRMEFGLKLAKLTTVTFSKFTESLPNPTHISLFKAEPLAGIGVLDLNPRLALTIADRLLGGRGHSVKAERDLTEIEVALVEDVTAILLEEWCGQWKSEQELHPLIIGHENNGRFLQTSARDAVMLAMTLECTFGDCSEQIQLAVPYHTIEPVVKKMQARRQKETAVPSAVKRADWQPAYDRLVVPVRAEWQAFELTVREITSLRVGDVIEMQPSICADTRLLLNGTPKFVGTVGLNTDRVAVQITRKLLSEEFQHANSDGRKVS